MLGDHYRRMRGRMGPIGANTIVAHKLARILWHLVTHQHEYDESVLVSQTGHGWRSFDCAQDDRAKDGYAFT